MNSRTRPVPVVPIVRVGPLLLESGLRPRAASNPAPPAESWESAELTCLALFVTLKLWERSHVNYNGIIALRPAAIEHLHLV